MITFQRPQKYSYKKNEAISFEAGNKINKICDDRFHKQKSQQSFILNNSDRREYNNMLQKTG